MQQFSKIRGLFSEDNILEKTAKAVCAYLALVQPWLETLQCLHLRQFNGTAREFTLLKIRFAFGKA